MQRRMVGWEVKRCTNAWFQEKAHEVEIAVRKGRGAWKGLRAIQRRRAGLRPERPNAIKDLDGKLCACQDSTSFDVNAIDRVEQHENVPSWLFHQLRKK